jgi:hypothetical protein
MIAVIWNHVKSRLALALGQFPITRLPGT